MKTRDIKIGDCFGRLTVLSIHRGAPYASLVCRCDCGTVKEFRTANVIKPNHTTSCGCARDEKVSKINFTHGSTRTPLYFIWRNIINRCTNPKIDCYPYYGGRGISLCEEWKDFANFQSWSFANGYTKERQIDRINNDGNYEPSNCRWVTQIENRRNRGDVKFFVAFGESKMLIEWAADPRCVVSFRTLRARIDPLGWDAEKAITTPVQRNQYA